MEEYNISSLWGKNKSNVCADLAKCWKLASNYHVNNACCHFLALLAGGQSLTVSSSLSCDSASLGLSSHFHIPSLWCSQTQIWWHCSPAQSLPRGHHCWDVLTPDLASREPNLVPCTSASSLDPIPLHHPPGAGVLPGLHRSFRVSLSTLSLGSFPPLLIPSCFGGRGWFPDLSVSLVWNLTSQLCCN